MLVQSVLPAIRRFGVATTLSLLTTLAVPVATWAAESVYFTVAGLELSISVADIGTWAETGDIPPELGPYLSVLSSAQQTQLRQLLTTRYDENYFNLSYMTYTAIGERFLRNLNRLVYAHNQEHNLEKLRTALVNATDDPAGLTFLNVLRQFPGDMVIDVGQIMTLLQRVNTLATQTDDFTAKVTATTQAAIPIAKTPADWPLDLRAAGAHQTDKQSLQAPNPWDQTRPIAFDLYLPATTAESALPMVVITAGFGAEQDFFAGLAHHLASHGLGVIIPVHGGSNQDRRRAFFRGEHQELFEATEYVNRPREITAILDELTRLNPQQFQNRLNLQQVGVFSHSFGGATALALAGAQVNRGQLQQDCGPQMELLNISLLYQCHALNLANPQQATDDPRIKAIFLLGPFSRALYGHKELSQLNIPLLWEATDIDLPAPLLLEQLPAFEWLTAPERYLVISNRLPHAHITFEVLAGLVEAEQVSYLKTLAETYQKALTLAFFKVYVAQDETFRPYLQPDYAQAISEAPYRLNLLPPDAVTTLLRNPLPTTAQSSVSNSSKSKSGVD